MGKEKDYREQIDRSVKRLAKALNIIEALHGELEFVFEHTDWNSEVNWQIEENNMLIARLDDCDEALRENPENVSEG